MPHPVYVPCVNINDDIVQIVDFNIDEKGSVEAGQIIAAVETDKAVVDVEAERSGYILKVLCEIGDKVPVGSVMMWIGDSPDEPVPEPQIVEAKQGTTEPGNIKPTAKAQMLLEKHNLKSEDIPCQGNRLTVQDIERFIATQADPSAKDNSVQVQKPVATDQRPATPGTVQTLNAEEQGMISTVTWHRDQAVSAYLEISYNQSAWEEFASAFAKKHKFMFSPLLPLMAYRLTTIARRMQKINTTLVNGEKYVYDRINLGFTVQVGETLYLTVVQKADKMGDVEFVNALGEVQRHAMAKKLRPQESTDSTIGFSSMARWKVSRHIPVLAPYTTMMVAHSAPSEEHQSAVLGASYDHRILNGHDVTNVLLQLALPPESS